MKVKITILCLFLFFFSACFDSDKTEDKNLENVQNNKSTKLPVNRLVKFSLNIHKSDELLKLQRISNENKDLKIEDNNKIVIFNFFTTWCPPCTTIIPYFNNLAQKYGDNLRIIGVLLENKSQDEIDEFIKENNINYEVTSGDNAFAFFKILGEINGIPYTALYDRDGKNVSNYLGAIYQEMIDIDIQKVIK